MESTFYCAMCVAVNRLTMPVVAVGRMYVFPVVAESGGW